MIRSVSFVDRVELDYSGSILPGAVALGDIDNDNINELVVGTISGEMMVFKEDRLWQTITGLGMIACIGVGDIMKCGCNTVAAISSEGWCHFYMCINQNQPSPCEKLQLVYQRKIPTNTKFMVLGDVIGDGQIDVILGLTDRVVRIYRWVQTRQVASLVCLNKFECASQIASICIGRNNSGSPCILVSQPGATYMTISKCTDENPLVEYHEVPLPKLTTSSISSQIVGCVGNERSISIVTLDGTIAYINDQKITWSLSVEQQLFAAAKARIVKEDPSDQLVVAAWSGHTYIIDSKSNMVCFELGQAIQSFIIGTYGARKATSFVYATYSNKIFIYYNVLIERMVLYSLYALQAQDPELAKYTKAQLKELTELVLYNMPGPSKKSSEEEKKDP